MAGVQNIKNLGSLLKLGVIAVVQAVARDGFQPTDLFAPLSSAEFNERLKPVIAGYKEIIHEIADISFGEGVELVQGALSGLKDVYTEVKVASAAMKKSTHA